VPAVPGGKESDLVTSAAIYARVSSARQKKDQTISSQTAALRAHAELSRLEVPGEWVFEDEGHSGATLIRPGLEALRDLAAQGLVDVVLCYSPDRLARKFAYQALLIEEFARAGVRVEFVKGPRGDSPEDQLLVQFQGMFAEYEKAQIAERYRRGNAHRARTGSVNVLSGAPFGYRYVRKSDLASAVYQVIEDEAALVAEMFRRYADDGASIAGLARWLSGTGVLTRTGKDRWDRSVIWGMLRNPAYAGTAVFGKTMVISEPAGLNRAARLQGRSVPRPSRTVDRPPEDWTAIPVPAIVTAETFQRVQQRLADNKRFAARNTKVPSLLQGLAACAACGYGYYRTSTRTTSKTIDFSWSRASPRKATTSAFSEMNRGTTPSTPAVRAPLLPRTRSHAMVRKSGSYTRLNRSSNRRPASRAAQWCSLACIRRTRCSAGNKPGQVSGSLVFTSASSPCSSSSARIRWTPSPCARLSRARTTTGPPPRPVAISRRRAFPPAPAWQAGAGGDHQRFPR
jgi:DNA invertase Pin-like site-specific DNA recombinase